METLSYLLIIAGTFGMLFFYLEFPFSTRIPDLKYDSKKILGLNGYYFWLVSFFALIVGAAIQLIYFWFPIS
jgi:hypothetical protein